jgi:NAD(P)-dependent dehydrogenase (short-subunit alcohol dehydrogenase family)
MTPVTHSYVTHLAQEHGWPVDEAERQSRYIAEYAPQPVPRLGNPGEIASAVAFLASPLSDYTTGAVLRVDGGATRGL